MAIKAMVIENMIGQTLRTTVIQNTVKEFHQEKKSTKSSFLQLSTNQYEAF